MKEVNDKEIDPKAEASTNDNPEVVEDPIRILKIRTCESRTGLSTLTYHVGCDPDSELHFRLYANTGNGFFNNDWVSLADIEAAVFETPFTSASLKDVYPNRSTNSPGFLLAALLEEGLVQVLLSPKRCYGKGDFEAFRESMRHSLTQTPP